MSESPRRLKMQLHYPLILLQEKSLWKSQFEFCRRCVCVVVVFSLALFMFIAFFIFEIMRKLTRMYLGCWCLTPFCASPAQCSQRLSLLPVLLFALPCVSLSPAPLAPLLAEMAIHCLALHISFNFCVLSFQLSWFIFVLYFGLFTVSPI